MAILKIRDSNGNVQDILAFKGEKGDKGDAYVLTEADKQEIAEMTAEIIQTNIPSAEGVSY